MTFLWPWSFALLGLIPILIGVYIWMLRRKRRFTIRYSSLSLVREALPRHSRWRRHLPFALFLLALLFLVIALTRPVTIASVPTSQTTIILAMDVSRSMGFNDVPPSRLEAAESAALDFIRRQKPGTQIGIVAFSGYAEMIQPPTTDRNALENAVESLTLGRATAIGAGILQSINAIANIDKNVAPPVLDETAVPPPPVPKGAYAPDIIVLLTDGVSNTGPLPLDAAQQAVDRGVRVYTIGFGTERGPDSFGRGFDNNGGGGGNGFFNNGGGGGGGGGFGGFGGFRRGIDETTLKQIASMTGGNYYAAASASELEHVFQSLPTYLIMRHEINEISVAFTALGAVLAGLAVVLSLRWHPLP